MARLSVDEIQSRIASVVDQDENTANISATDYSLRLKYINTAQSQWAEIQDWQVLYAEYNTHASTSTGNASVVLPANFRKLASYPEITYDGVTTEQFPEVLPQDDGQYHDDDHRLWILGSPADGYILRVHGATLASGASIKVPYYKSVGSLASPANIPDIPNADYLVKSAIAQLWEAREDTRYPQAKAEAERILANMIEFENIYNKASDYDRVKTTDEIKNDFRIGRD